MAIGYRNGNVGYNARDGLQGGVDILRDWAAPIL